MFIYFRKELLQELTDVDIKVDAGFIVQDELEEGEINSSTISECQTIPHSNTSLITSTSEESQDKLLKRKTKKKLKVVQQLEKKILKTPIKKEPKGTNKSVEKDVSKINKRKSKDIETKNGNNTFKLRTLFDETENFDLKLSSDTKRDVKQGSLKEEDRKNTVDKSNETVTKNKPDKSNFNHEETIVDNKKNSKTSNIKVEKIEEQIQTSKNISVSTTNIRLTVSDSVSIDTCMKQTSVKQEHKFKKTFDEKKVPESETTTGTDKQFRKQNEYDIQLIQHEDLSKLPNQPTGNLKVCDDGHDNKGKNISY